MPTEIYLGNPPENIVKWIKAEAERKQQEMLKTPLHFTANEPGANILLKTSDGSSWCEFVYSTDEMKTWNDYHVNTDIIQLDDCKNRTVYLKAKYPIEYNECLEPQDTPNRHGLGDYGSRYHNFIINGQVKANGNIQFLIDSNGIFDEAYDYAFNNLFENCNSLIEAPLILPAKYAYRCAYNRMFTNCTSLVKGPSKILNYSTASELYREMFLNCQSLETVPLLTYDISDEYAEAVFFNMFRNCTSLKDISGLRNSKQLFPDNTKIGSNVCRGMFYGCSSLVTVPSNFLNGIIDVDEYSDGNYNSDEYDDQAYFGCFADMFAYCTSLDFPNDELYVNVENPRSYCFAGMFTNCESLTKPLRVSCSNYSENCFESMYRNCTSLTYAELPNDSITEIPDYCFRCMFEGCHSLSDMYSHIPSTSNFSYGYMLASCKSPFTMRYNTFDEVVELIENNMLLGDYNWYDENGDVVNPIEIICSDKTMLATNEGHYWTLTEK